MTNADIATAVALALDAAGARSDCNMRPVVRSTRIVRSETDFDLPRWIEVDVWYATDARYETSYAALYGLDAQTGEFALYQD